jgi:hypothetical protein
MVEYKRLHLILETGRPLSQQELQEVETYNNSQDIYHTRHQSDNVSKKQDATIIHQDITKVVESPTDASPTDESPTDELLLDVCRKNDIEELKKIPLQDRSFEQQDEIIQDSIEQERTELYTSQEARYPTETPSVKIENTGQQSQSQSQSSYSSMIKVNEYQHKNTGYTTVQMSLINNDEGPMSYDGNTFGSNVDVPIANWQSGSGNTTTIST